MEHDDERHSSKNEDACNWLGNGPKQDVISPSETRRLRIASVANVEGDIIENHHVPLAERARHRVGTIVDDDEKQIAACRDEPIYQRADEIAAVERDAAVDGKLIKAD